MTEVTEHLTMARQHQWLTQFTQDYPAASGRPDTGQFAKSRRIWATVYIRTNAKRDNALGRALRAILHPDATRPGPTSPSLWAHSAALSFTSFEKAVRCSDTVLGIGARWRCRCTCACEQLQGASRRARVGRL